MPRKHQVLLVDDDDDFLKAYSLLLEEAGYEVITASDGSAGLAAAREHRPDVIVTDVIMKRPDEGFVLARAIRADRDLAGIKVIILTIAAQQYQMLFEPDALWLPVDKVMEKPAAPDVLIREIATLLGEAEGETEDSK